MIITDKQWEEYEKRYSKLMYGISRKISGDEAISSIEDNYADLCIAALASIKGFWKKTGKSFDEMMQEKLFDKYTKTVLWNYKNYKGAKITEKKNLAKTVSIEDCDAAFDIEDKRMSLNLGLPVKPKSLAQEQVINCIVNNPSCILLNGKLNVTEICKNTKLTRVEVEKAILNIGKNLIKVL